MELHGKHILGAQLSADGQQIFQAVNPATGEKIGPMFHEATPAEIDRALELAQQAFEHYRKVDADTKTAFLERVADELERLGNALVDRAAVETGLSPDRLTAERTRTVNQTRMFAALVREGSWVEARIDTALPDRKPVARPDLRRMLLPIGPVVVFGASNFPLAFSVAGGDTASALAAGNPVVFKAHPAHPGTCELTARAIASAVEAAGLPEGLFSMVHGTSEDVGLRLVRHRLARAVGFTGSLRGGRSLFDAAAARAEPIRVYAEMGSINPVFLLPGAVRERGPALAEGLKQSVTLGVGQFCTNPGLVIGLQDDSFAGFVQKVGELFAATVPGTMLHAGISQAYQQGVERFRQVDGVRIAGQSKSDPAAGQARAVAFMTDIETFLRNQQLSQEVFGPSTLIVAGRSDQELKDLATSLEGHLTAAIHGTEQDLDRYQWLVSILEDKVGRLIFNGFPTGVEVSAAMHHGGPYPATTDVRSTSVGTAAIQRFARPICYQNFPAKALPAELRNENPRQIWRLVNNVFTREAI